MYFSINLPGTGKREIGRRSVGYAALVTLGIGVTVAVFHLSGNTPVRRILL